MKFLVFALLAIAIASGDLVKESKKICEPGTLTKMDCNNCICSKDGTSRVCTLMACPPLNLDITRARRQTKEKVCEPGETKMEDCNNCFCTPDGSGFACTLMACSTFNLDTTRARRQTKEKVCEPGETKMEDCNNCFCTPDGSGFACTLMGCPEKKIICEPGKRYKKYCNTCGCSSDGTAEICTKMECPKNIFNPDGSLVNPEIVTENPLLRQRRQIGDNKPCVPGTYFKRYCNSCRCGADGVSAACTLMLCPKDIYNEDGTVRNIEGVSSVPYPMARSKISS